MVCMCIFLFTVIHQCLFICPFSNTSWNVVLAKSHQVRYILSNSSEWFATLNPSVCNLLPSGDIKLLIWLSPLQMANQCQHCCMERTHIPQIYLLLIEVLCPLLGKAVYGMTSLCRMPSTSSIGSSFISCLRHWPPRPYVSCPDTECLESLLH